jgi:hypothetical protein
MDMNVEVVALIPVFVGKWNVIKMLEKEKLPSKACGRQWFIFLVGK